MGGSKKYKGKLCAYCRINISTTADHIFPRELFQVYQRGDLPKAASCSDCNNKKSKLEHYLLSVLPFGATHSNAHKALSVDTAERLKKNKKLHKRLQNELSYKFIPTSKDISENRMVIPFDPETLNEFISMVGRGLSWYHWKKYLPTNCESKIFTPSPSGIQFLSKLFNLSTSYRVNIELADGTVRYKGVFSEIDEGLSIWTIQLLGGITVSNQEASHTFHNSFIAVITGTPEILESISIT